MEIVGHKTVYISAYYNPKIANERGYDEFRISIERASNIRMVLDPLVGCFTSCAIPLSSNMSANFS
jgi:hypothetical protein